MYPNDDWDSIWPPQCLSTLLNTSSSCSNDFRSEQDKRIQETVAAPFDDEVGRSALFSTAAVSPSPSPLNNHHDAFQPVGGELFLPQSLFDFDSASSSVSPPSVCDSFPSGATTNANVSPATVSHGSFDSGDCSVWASTPIINSIDNNNNDKNNLAGSNGDFSLALDEWLAQEPLLTEPQLSDLSQIISTMTDAHTTSAIQHQQHMWAPAPTVSTPEQSQPPRTQPTAPLTPPTPTVSMSAASVSATPSMSPPPSRPGRKRARDQSDPEESQAEKRRRNNIAAAKCRQKKLDRITELEMMLADVHKERDDLKRSEERRVGKECRN